MKITIAGAGAMGSRFGLMLHQAGQEVLLVDGWQEHVNQIKNHGLQGELNGKQIKEKIAIELQTELSISEKTDLIILFTKTMQLDQMLQDLKMMISSDTKVLCLLNGIGHEDVIEKYVPLENIFIGNTMWTAGLQGPGRVKLFGQGSVELQNLGENQAEAAKKLAEVLSEADLNAIYSENIRYSIYRKACVNGTMNGLCTILDANMAELGRTSAADAMITQIVGEFALVAAREGVVLDTDEVFEHIKTCFNPETIGLHHPSMYQDLIQNHRLTEIDYINGAVSRKGLKYGIKTPYCDFLTMLVHSKEELLGAK